MDQLSRNGKIMSPHVTTQASREPMQIKASPEEHKRKKSCCELHQSPEHGDDFSYALGESPGLLPSTLGGEPRCGNM